MWEAMQHGSLDAALNLLCDLLRDEVCHIAQNTYIVRDPLMPVYVCLEKKRKVQGNLGTNHVGDVIEHANLVGVGSPWTQSQLA